MGFNFPNAPAAGEAYTPVGGPTFTFDGVAWKAVSQGTPVIVYVSDTPPFSPAHGQLWWESDTGNLFIWYQDTDSGQWVQVNGTPGGYQTADSRNRIVNGAMQISQERGDIAVSITTTANYVADQWAGYGGSIVASAERSSSLAVSPNGTTTRLHFSVVTAKGTLAAGDVAQLHSPIEGTRVRDFQWGTANAKQAVLSFICRAHVAGTYCVGVRNAAVDRSWLGTFNIPVAGIDTAISMVIPGDTAGTWPKDNTLGMYVLFSFGCGATFHGVTGWQAGDKRGIASMANAASVVGNVSVTDVGLYLDPDNTGVPPKWQMPDEAEELAACQRYWFQVPYIITSNSQRYGAAGMASADAGSMSFPVTMRTAPALVATTAPTLQNCSAFSTQTFYNEVALRVTVTAAGQYRAVSGAYSFNARM